MLLLPLLLPLLPLLSSPRDGRRRRPSLLPVAAVLLCVASVSVGLPAGSKCPHHIDCAKQGRHFCKLGSSRCGPCLSPLWENRNGRCVHRQQVTFYSDLDEEIDYLGSVIEKQEATENKPPKQQSKHLVSAAVTSQTDVKENTDTPKQKSRSQLSAEALHAVTTAPGLTSAPPGTPTAQPRATGDGGRVGPIVVPTQRNDKIIVIMVSVCVAVGTVAVILATVCYIKLQKESRLAQKVDYPAFGGTGVSAAPPNGASVGDKTLAQSAQMYHYQHQKQQMLSMGNHKPEQKVLENEVTSDEEEVGGDFTVYECPGLAPTGEMEVKNPLFDDSTIHYQGNCK